MRTMRAGGRAAAGSADLAQRGPAAPAGLRLSSARAAARAPRLLPASRRDWRTRRAAAEADAGEPSSSAAAAAPQSEPPAAASPAAAEEPAASSSAGGGVSLLAAAEPVDRLRYQAMLIFEHFDTARAGRLSGEQLQQFFTWCTRKVSWSPGLSEVLQQVQERFTPLTDSGCSREDFIRVVRTQVHAVSTSPAYQGTMLRPDEAARLQAQMSLSKVELAAAKWMFGLLDFDNDGKVSLAMYGNAQGIEAYMFEDKIEDADADEDGFVTFQEWLGSYARPKPIVKNLLIMAVNTAVIYFILQAPLLDVMLKVVLVGVLMLRPQLVSKPASLLYDAVKAIIDQGRAQAELAKSSRGVWRPA